MVVASRPEKVPAGRGFSPEVPGYGSAVDEADLDALVKEAQLGSRAAFARFIRATNEEVWAFCARLVGRADADDATQETYLGAWRSLHSFRGESTARTWLFVIARRTAYRTMRKSSRWSELAMKAPAPVEGPPAGTLVEIEQALDALPVDQRSALVLTQLLGFSYAEAASICECATGTIRSRVARARERLAAAEAEMAAGTG